MNRFPMATRYSIAISAAAVFAAAAQPQMQAHPSIPIQAQQQTNRPMEQANSSNLLTVIHLQQAATPQATTKIAQLQKVQIKAASHLKAASVTPAFTTPDQIAASLGALTPNVQIYAGQPLKLGITQSTSNAYFRAAITGGSGDSSSGYESAFFPDYPDYGWRAGNAEMYGPGSVTVYASFGPMASRLVVDCAAVGFYVPPVVDVYATANGNGGAAGPFPIPQSGHLSVVLDRADAPTQIVAISFDKGGGDFNGCQFTPIK